MPDARAPAARPGRAAGSTTCWPPTGWTALEEHYLQVTLTDPSPAAGADGAAARAGSRTSWSSRFAPRAGADGPVASYAERLRGRSDLRGGDRLRRRTSAARPSRPRRPCWPRRSRRPRGRGGAADAAAPAGGHRLRAVRRHRDGRLRRAGRRPACSCSPARPAPGKTSILDAVCFALYGQVPGARGTARAAAQRPRRRRGRGPPVVLEVTLRGRRLRVTRSPAWERPKRRGTGTTTEQAQVHLEERTGGRLAHAVDPARRGRRPGRRACSA